MHYCRDDFRDTFHDDFHDVFRETIESPPWARCVPPCVFSYAAVAAVPRCRKKRQEAAAATATVELAPKRTDGRRTISLCDVCRLEVEVRGPLYMSRHVWGNAIQ